MKPEPLSEGDPSPNGLARFAAQRLAFAPLMFQACRALRDLGILEGLARARDRGLTLDSSGLSRRGRRLAVRSEADIYRHLGLPFIAPEMREDAGEIEGRAPGSWTASHRSRSSCSAA